MFATLILLTRRIRQRLRFGDQGHLSTEVTLILETITTTDRLITILMSLQMMSLESRLVDIIEMRIGVELTTAMTIIQMAHRIDGAGAGIEAEAEARARAEKAAA
jgi:hypothetical protein